MLMITRLVKQRLRRFRQPELTELLQLSRCEALMREHCRKAVQKRLRWKKEQRLTFIPRLALYNHMVGTMLRRHVRDAAACYRAIRQERIRLFEDYLERLPHRVIAKPSA